MNNQFEVKDSGKRAQFASGMVRDTAEDKIEYHRVLDGPMLERWAIHLTKGKKKYPDIAVGKANWLLAKNAEERQHARESALRHFLQWWRGDKDEDHAAAVFFNLNLVEYVDNLNKEVKS